MDVYYFLGLPAGDLWRDGEDFLSKQSEERN